MPTLTRIDSDSSQIEGGIQTRLPFTKTTNRGNGTNKRKDSISSGTAIESNNKKQKGDSGVNGVSLPQGNKENAEIQEAKEQIEALDDGIAREKNFVKLKAREGQKVVSLIWTQRLFYMGKLTQEGYKELRDKAGTVLKSQVAGLAKIAKYQNAAVCMLCFNNPKIELKHCVFSAPRWNPSNLDTHLCNAHNENEAPYFFSCKEKKIIDTAKKLILCFQSLPPLILYQAIGQTVF